MNELTREEVLHVAHLARIEVNDNEIEKYKKELKQIMDEINKINEVNVNADSFIISPTLNTNMYREDVSADESIDFKQNAPKTSGNYIEVRRFLND